MKTRGLLIVFNACLLATLCEGFLDDANAWGSHAPFQCPRSCSSSHTTRCLQGNFGLTQTCRQTQFCELTINNRGTIHGQCQTGSSRYDLCGRHMALGASVTNSGTVMACCTNTACLNKALGIAEATTTPPVTTPPVPSTVVISSTVASTSLYERFKTNCSDQLEDGVCSLLIENEDVCHKHNIELCPALCGVCDVIAKTNCHDTILNNGCQTEYVAKGICSDPLAKYTCPDSCGLCDSIVNQKIQDLLATTTTATTTAV